MRADRLVASLIVLRARGRVPSAELAAGLGVSIRTAQRELEALATAPIPVFAQRGGGWSLPGTDAGIRTFRLYCSANPRMSARLSAHAASYPNFADQP